MWPTMPEHGAFLGADKPSVTPLNKQMFPLPVAINFKEVLRKGVDKTLDFKIAGKWVKPHL